MTSLMTSRPLGEGMAPTKAAETVAAAPATVWPWMSTPATFNRLVPGWSGTVAVQLVTVGQVSG